MEIQGMKRWTEKDQVKTAGREAGRASHALVSVFKLERSSSASEDLKLPIARNPSHFCPSVLQHGYQPMAEVGCWAREVSVWHEATRLTFGSWDIPWKGISVLLRHILENPQSSNWAGRKVLKTSLHHIVWMRCPTHIHVGKWTVLKVYSKDKINMNRTTNKNIPINSKQPSVSFSCRNEPYGT